MRKTVHPVSSNTQVTTGLICVFSECSHCTAPLTLHRKINPHNRSPTSSLKPQWSLYSDCFRTTPANNQWMLALHWLECPAVVLWQSGICQKSIPFVVETFCTYCFQHCQAFKQLFILVKLFSCLQWRLFKNNKSERALHVFEAEHVSLALAAAKLISKNWKKGI